MRDLIERLEAATGPDRDLDIAIWRAGLRPDAPATFVPLPWLHNYTSSIDDALTLVPEGWKWSLFSADDRAKACAYIVPAMGRLPWPEWVEDIHAATPALALCIAALKAREAGHA